MEGDRPCKAHLGGGTRFARIGDTRVRVDRGGAGGVIRLTNRSSGSAVVLLFARGFVGPKVISLSSRNGLVETGRGGFAGDSRKGLLRGEGEVVRLRNGLLEERLRVRPTGERWRSGMTWSASDVC